MSTNASNEPRLGVHELAAFAFCNRAGLLAFESKRVDDGNELGLARLDFSHCYEFDELRAQLSQLLNWIIWVSLGLLVALICRWIAQGTVLLLVTLLQLSLLCFLGQLGWKAYCCYRSLHRFETLPARSPDALSLEDEAVDWWCLRADDFEAILPPSPFHDEQTNIIGKPWRLLRKGPLLIPVFRCRKPDNIKTQHRLRVAAYCHLIEACEGSQSPYGIALDPRGYSGTAIKITDELRSLTSKHVAHARETINRAVAAQRHDPAPPRNEDKCRNCPFGRAAHAETDLRVDVRGQNVETYPLTSPEGKEFHSLCGDRFHWRPPHKTLLERSWVE